MHVHLKCGKLSLDSMCHLKGRISLNFVKESDVLFFIFKVIAIKLTKYGNIILTNAKREKRVF